MADQEKELQRLTNQVAALKAALKQTFLILLSLVEADTDEDKALIKQRVEGYLKTLETLRF